MVPHPGAVAAHTVGEGESVLRMLLIISIHTTKRFGTKSMENQTNGQIWSKRIFQITAVGILEKWQVPMAMYLLFLQEFTGKVVQLSFTFVWIIYSVTKQNGKRISNCLTKKLLLRTSSLLLLLFWSSILCEFYIFL